MKKWIVIATMALSMTVFTACGTKSDTTSDTDVSTEQKEDTNETEDVSDSTQETDTQEESDETSDDADKDETEEEEETKDSGKKKKDKTQDSDEEETELVETGETPDFEVNKKGCFSGKYEGNDGCVYKFTKKGILTITSDTETVEYEYSLDGDRLNMVATDGSIGKLLQITLLEDGTYLLDNAMGTQVILTYMK